MFVEKKKLLHEPFVASGDMISGIEQKRHVKIIICAAFVVYARRPLFFYSAGEIVFIENLDRRVGLSGYF